MANQRDNKNNVAQEIVETKEQAKNFTLEQIEEEMCALVTTCTNATMFLNSKKIEMLDRIANLKIKRIQIEQSKQALALANSNQTVAEPIKVEFVSPNTTDNVNRIEKLQKDVEDALGGNKNNA